MVLRVRVRACTVATTSPSWSLESRRTRVASLPAMGVRSVITRSVAAFATPCTTADALGDHLARCQGIGAVPADRSRSLWPMAIPHDARLKAGAADHFVLVEQLILHRQHLSRWLHMRQCQSCGLSKPRGSSSLARVASMILTVRSLHACAPSALNGTKKCNRSQVSALSAVKSAGLVMSR